MPHNREYNDLSGSLSVNESDYKVDNVNMQGLIKPGSETWYWLNEWQFTMPCYVVADPDNDTIKDLTAEGLAAYRNALVRARTAPITSRLYNGLLIPASCGKWLPDTNSLHYKPDDPKMIICHMADIRLHGKMDENSEQVIATSVIRWYGELADGQKWVITRSGSLYYY